jgi:WhiB family transcriptional regulator, redox-sensing transcriptional regulator
MPVMRPAAGALGGQHESRVVREQTLPGADIRRERMRYTATGRVMNAHQRVQNRNVAHRMARCGQSPAEIAAHLGITTRSVHRYLQEPCPAATAPTVQLSDFYTKGACAKRLDIEWVSEDGTHIDAAKRVCARCVVADECRTYGLTTGLDDQGIWGGLTRPERRRIVKQREAAA